MTNLTGVVLVINVIIMGYNGFDTYSYFEYLGMMDYHVDKLYEDMIKSTIESIKEGKSWIIDSIPAEILGKNTTFL